MWQLARAAAASGAVSSPAPAAGSPSVRANVTMSEAEGGWSDLLHESALEASSNFSVGYSKSLTVGVKKKKIIPLCHVAHELTNRTYGEKK